MRQLTGLDAQFLAIETPRQSAHVSMLMVLDPSTRPSGSLELDDVHALVAQRLPLLAPFRWRLREVPFGLDYPYWIDDPDFDLSYHLRVMALPPPLTDEQLATQVVRIAARPLDRARPLWELYLIHGLEHGHVAVLAKIHHAAVDGISGVELLGALLDVSPEGRDLPPAGHRRADRTPGELEMFARALVGAPRYVDRAARALPTLLSNLEDNPFLSGIPGARTLGRAARIARSLPRPHSTALEPTTLKPPRTSFNGRVSPHRELAFGQLSLQQAKAVKDEHGCTVNDVIVAACAGAVRRWLIEHRELPDGPLVAQAPISVRTDHQRGTFGNRFGVLSTPLYTNEPDPLKRLALTHEALRDAKHRHRAVPDRMLQHTAEFIPPPVLARATRATLWLAAARRPVWNLVVSNMAGPQVPLYCAGAEVQALYPFSFVTDGLGLTITVFSYRGHIDIGIVADREQMPDAWKLIGWLQQSLAELDATAEPGRAVNGPTDRLAGDRSAARAARR